jgi:high affinity sulfate transporter 1
MGGNQSVGLRNSWLARIAPGLANLLSYKLADLAPDLVAGLSVAAVAIPVGVAYAQLAGFNPAVGLYASILPMLAYAVFGTSRQLIVGPDAAVCALVAAAVAPLAGGDNNLYLSLTVALTFFAGVFSIAASFLQLGGLADFLSKPILVGFLNGVALSIALGQIGKIFGFAIAAGGIVPRLVEFLSKIHMTHLPTLALGVAAFALLVGSPKLFPRIPAALLAMAVAALVVKVLNLERIGVKIIGPVPAGLPPLRLPHFPSSLVPSLLAEAAGVTLISFSSMMLTARSFASKNRYDIDPDREFAALGVANIASAVSQGFAVSGADSRTAVNDAAGGRTQMAGLMAAAVIAAVLMFFTEPLQYVPSAALGAVLVKAALSLTDWKTLKMLYHIDRREFALSALATVGVVAVGAVKAILVVVLLAVGRFVRLVCRPKIEILGSVPRFPGFHSLERHENAKTVSGVLLFRFNAPIVFFNAPYFKREALAAAEAAGANLKWFVMDMIPITMIDATGLYIAEEVVSTLAARGIVFVAAGRQTEWQAWAGTRPQLGTDHILRFPTLEVALTAYSRETGLERSGQSTIPS